MKQILDSDYYLTPCGAVVSMKWGRVTHLKQVPTKRGWMHVNLTLGKPHRQKTFTVNKLFRLAHFPDAETVDHLNFDKSDNCIWNLEGVSVGENVRRAWAAGRMENAHGVKWTAHRKPRASRRAVDQPPA